MPKQEQYELASQLRRASKSIAINIAEGYGRNSTLEDFKRFIIIAIGSCDEVRVQLDYCKDLGYMSKENYDKYSEEYEIIGRMLTKMLKVWRRIPQ
jgi:four helix bundle protein